MTGTGTDPSNPRQHGNGITGWIDASNVYGSDIDRATWIRTFSDGKMKISNYNLLPWNTVTGNINDEIDFNAPFMADDTRSLTKYFVAGDIRANENPLLLCDPHEIKKFFKIFSDLGDGAFCIGTHHIYIFIYVPGM